MLFSAVTLATVGLVVTADYNKNVVNCAACQYTTRPATYWQCSVQCNVTPGGALSAGM